MAKKIQVTDDDFAAQIRTAFLQAADINLGQLGDDRVKALEYYLGKPFGDEVRGRSQVVLSDVSDTIEWILPNILDIYTSAERVVEFLPETAEDVEGAEQASDTVNYLFLKKNNGFLILYEWFKDALLQKNGIVKYWWENKVDETVESYAGLTAPELSFVLQDDAVEIVEANVRVNTVGEQIYDVQVRHRRTEGNVQVAVIPPEEFVISRDHNSIDISEAELCGHRSRKTRSELISMGYSAEEVDSLPKEEVWAEEQIMARDVTDEGTVYEESLEPNYLYDEIYALFDKDGDGVAERYKVCMVGSTLLSYELFDHVPFAAITPIIMTHRFHGRSIAETVMDIQHTKSTIIRQMMDNLYLTNNPRMRILQGMVNLTDLTQVRPGGLIRMDDINAVQPLDIPFVARESFPMIEYLDTVRENRTGVTRYNQGLDANSLNKTAHGLTQVMDASKQRLKLIARVFAETGVKNLFQGILHLVTKYQTKEMIIRLRNEYVPVDPREWKNKYNMTCSVGLGTGNKEQQMQSLMMVYGAQKEAFAAHPGYVVEPQHMYNTISKMLHLQGFPDVDRYFKNPGPGMPQVPPKKSEEELRVEANKTIELQKIESDRIKDVQKANIEADVTRARIHTQADTELKSAAMRTAADLKATIFKEAIKVAAAYQAKGIQVDVTKIAKELSEQAEVMAENFFGASRENID